MQRLRRFYAVGFMISLVGCANVHRPPVAAPPVRGPISSSTSFPNAVSSRVSPARATRPAPAVRGSGASDASQSLARYFPGLTQPAVESPAPVVARRSLFARPQTHALTPTGARIAGRAPTGGGNRSRAGGVAPVRGVAAPSTLAAAAAAPAPSQIARAPQAVAAVAATADNDTLPGLPVALTLQAYPDTETDRDAREPVRRGGDAIAMADSVPGPPASILDDLDPAEPQAETRLDMDNPLERALAATLGTTSLRDDRARLVRADLDDDNEPLQTPRRLLDVRDTTASAAVEQTSTVDIADLDLVLSEADAVQTASSTVGGEPETVEPRPTETLAEAEIEIEIEAEAPVASVMPEPTPEPDTGQLWVEDPALAGRPRLPLIRQARPEPAMAPTSTPTTATARARTVVPGLNAGLDLPPVQFPATYYADGDAGATTGQVDPRWSQPPAAESSSILTRLRTRVRRLNPFRDDEPGLSVPMTRAAMPTGNVPSSGRAAQPSDLTAPGDDSVTRTGRSDAIQVPAGVRHRADCPCKCQK